MTTAMRHDRYVGPYHYWIRFYNGTHEVRETETDNEFDPITTVYRGHYEECVKYIDNREVEYMESLF
jgi:hypothetical protein